jgi:hypothetical protein
MVSAYNLYRQKKHEALMRNQQSQNFNKTIDYHAESKQKIKETLKGLLGDTEKVKNAIRDKMKTKKLSFHREGWKLEL